jgi:hypothetical protein
MKAKAVKNMINGNTALLHIGNFDTRKPGTTIQPILPTTRAAPCQLGNYVYNEQFKYYCPFTPAHVAKVFGGYMCFESDYDYRVWRNQK